MNYILLAIPFFILLISIEIAVDRYRKTGFYRINDAISSINAGVLSRINTVFRNLTAFTIYVFLEQYFALFDLPESTTLWVVAFVAYDFCYYWKHRFGHEINILWASHVVHHSSEEYNLTTALRQTSGGILGWVFYIPLALLGIEPIMMLSVASLNLLYQFWVHTRHIPKLGCYERLFVTPSNHRVHHATNQCYIDRNYGGVFIIWDKLFNTFQAELEQEPCNYGIRKALKSWDPIWTNLHFYAQLAKDAWYTKRWQDKLLIWIKPTGWRPVDVEEKFPIEKFNPASFTKFDIKIPQLNTWYSLFQHLIILLVFFLFLKNINTMDSTTQLLGGSYIVLSCFSIAALLEGRWWAIWLEIIRYAVVVIFSYMQTMPEQLFIAIVSISLFSLFTLFYIKPAGEMIAE